MLAPDTISFFFAEVLPIGCGNPGLERPRHRRSQKFYNQKSWPEGGAFLEERWALSLIGGSQVATNLVPRGTLCTPCEIQPVHENQVRPLRILEPAQQCEVWEEAVRSADGKVVTYHVKDTVKELTAPAAEPNHPSASHSGIPIRARGERLYPPAPLPWAPPLRAMAEL